MDNMPVIFEEQRTSLRAVASRLMDSVHEADDAVQETWLRLKRTDVSGVESLPAWLTTVVSRICLDQLRSRASRRKELGVEPDAAVDPVPDAGIEAEYASRNGRFDRLLALLHPEAVMSAAPAAAATGSLALISGADAVAQMFSGRAQGARPAELDGFAGSSVSCMWQARPVRGVTHSAHDRDRKLLHGGGSFVSTAGSPGGQADLLGDCVGGRVCRRRRRQFRLGGTRR